MARRKLDQRQRRRAGAGNEIRMQVSRTGRKADLRQGRRRKPKAAPQGRQTRRAGESGPGGPAAKLVRGRAGGEAQAGPKAAPQGTKDS